MRTVRNVTCTVLALAALTSCFFGPFGPPEAANITAVHPLELYAGEHSLFTADDLGNQDPDVHWNFGGGATPNESTERAPYVAAGAPGSYNCSVQAGGSSFAFTLTVLTPPVPEISMVRTGVPRIETYIDGSTVTVFQEGPLYAGLPGALSVYGLFQGTGPDGFFGERIPVTTWNWDLAGVTPRLSSARSPQFTPTTPGTYSGTVAVGNAGGTTEPFAFTYEVRELIPPNPGTVLIDLDNASPGTRSFNHFYQDGVDPGGPIRTYSWNFGGGFEPNTSTSVYPIGHTHTPGTFTGSVTIGNPAGNVTVPFTYTVTDFTL
jgi:hypothetical protein